MSSLSQEDQERLESLLIQDEALKLFVYLDTKGHRTIGVGRNLDAKGIRPDEAMLMLRNDINEAEALLQTNVNFYDSIDPIRKIVLIDMAFNLGFKILGFKKMWKALAEKDYLAASDEMLDSLWAKQVKNRSQRLSYIMETGKLNR